MATLRVDPTNQAPYVGKDRSDGEVEVYTNQRPEFVAVREYDATTTSVAAGGNVAYTVTNVLAGCSSVSVSIIGMTQTYRVSIETRPVSAASWYTEASVSGTALASLASARCGFTVDGPLGAEVRVVITNTSASAATLQGVYVSGR